MLSVLSIAAWTYLLLFRGRFWRADQRLDGHVDAAEDLPPIVAIIPARNEAGTIQEVVRSHRLTDYPPGYPVIVVDDASSDGTGEIARDAGATVVEAPPLPGGWSGKLWALHTGIEHADQNLGDTRYLLLTDADIVHAKSTATRLVTKARREGRAIVSLMARLDSRGFWGSLLIPAFVFFFQKLYPFGLVNHPESSVAGAAGGCILIDRQALSVAGGLEAQRSALIDDCTLAARIKLGPPRRSIWLGLSGDSVVSLRDNRSLDSVWAMVRRTAFTQLHHSVLLLAGSTIGMFVLYVWPVVATLAGFWHQDPLLVLGGAAGWSLMAIAYGPTIKIYRKPAWQTLGLPFAALLYMGMTIDSAWRHFRGTGGAWKGRTYP